MPKSATARREPDLADEATRRVDELIQLGRGQGYLSLTELRAAFGAQALRRRKAGPSSVSWRKPGCGWVTSRVGALVYKGPRARSEHGRARRT